MIILQGKNSVAVGFLNWGTAGTPVRVTLKLQADLLFDLPTVKRTGFFFLGYFQIFFSGFFFKYFPHSIKVIIYSQSAINK